MYLIKVKIANRVKRQNLLLIKGELIKGDSRSGFILKFYLNKHNLTKEVIIMKQNQVKKLIKLKLINLVSFLLTLILSMTLNAQYAQSQGFSHLDQAIAEQELLERLMNIDQMSLENLRAKLLAAEEDNEGAMAEDGTYITENGTYFIELSEEEANIITLFQDVADVFQYENAVSHITFIH